MKSTREMNKMKVIIDGKEYIEKSGESTYLIIVLRKIKAGEFSGL
jgi:hypothetical protein